MKKKQAWLTVSGLLVVVTALGLEEYQRATHAAHAVWAKDFFSGLCIGIAIVFALASFKKGKNASVLGAASLVLALVAVALRMAL